MIVPFKRRVCLIVGLIVSRVCHFNALLGREIRPRIPYLLSLPLGLIESATKKYAEVVHETRGFWKTSFFIYFTDHFTPRTYSLFFRTPHYLGRSLINRLTAIFL